MATGKERWRRETYGPFVEKAPGRRGPALANTGLYVLEPELVRRLRSAPSDFGHDVFPAAVARGERILAYRVPGPVIDVGTPEGLAHARRLTSGG